MSVDGFIATEDGDISFLSMVEKEGEDYGYQQFVNSVDTYMVGRKTYEKIKELCDGEFPQASQFDCYVISRNSNDKHSGVTFYNQSISELVANLKNQKGKDIYCDGGASLIQSLMKQGLIDEFIISIIPICLGNGIRLFQGGIKSTTLKHVSTKTFDSGLVQINYRA